MSTPEQIIRLDAATEQVVRIGLDGLRKLAEAPEYAGLDHNDAAPRLADALLQLGGPQVVASILANVLLDDVRRQSAEELFAGHVPFTVTPTGQPGTTPAAPQHSTTATTPAPAPSTMAGVEIRLIGPELSCRNILNQLDTAAVPLHGERGPLNATDRPGTVRLLAYTDEQTATDCRKARRAGNPDRPSRRRGRRGDDQ